MVRPIWLTFGSIGLLFNFHAFLVVLINVQLRRRHKATMLIFACNSTQILIVFFYTISDKTTFAKLMPYFIKFVSIWYGMTILFMVIERLLLVQECLHFGQKPQLLKAKETKSTLFVLVLALVLNIMLTSLTTSILPVTVTFTVLIISLYIVLLVRISLLMKKSTIARELLKGTARNYITTVLALFAVFSLSRDVAAPIFLKARNRYLQKTNTNCVEIEGWMKPLLVVHSLHWIIDPIVYFFYHKAPRQTCRQMLRDGRKSLRDFQTQLEILVIVYCPCDCPISIRKRQDAIRPAGHFYSVNRISISNNQNRATVQAD